MDTMARDIFDSFLMAKEVLDRITPNHYQIVRQFIHILKQETCIDVQQRFREEMQHFIHLALPDGVNPLHWDHRIATESFYHTAIEEMHTVIESLTEAAVAQFPPDWPEVQTPVGDALEVLTAMIFQDIPSLIKAVQDEDILLRDLTNISLSTHSVSQRSTVANK